MPVFIAALVDALLWLFKSRLGLILVSAFAWLGIQFGVQHLVVAPALDTLRSLASGGAGGGSFASEAYNWLGVLNFDRALSMVISAVTTKYAVTGAKLFLQKRV
jgi:hypothetical protein